MLLELAVADSYGAGFEYESADVMAAENDLTRMRRHTTHAALSPGKYTHDTQMSIAIAELLVSGAEWTPLNIASKFVEVYQRDKRPGYSRLFQQFLDQVTSGEEFLAKIKPDSDKSGAAMRATPLGIIGDIPTLLRKTQVQAVVTHNTPDGIAAAQASALLAHYFLWNRGPKALCGKYLERFVPDGVLWNTNYVGKVKAKGWMSVQAAVTAVKRNDNLADLLRDCVAFTGDVDTVAAIAVGAASNARDYKQNLPTALVAQLEPFGKYGAEYLKVLDGELLALVKA